MNNEHSLFNTCVKELSTVRINTRAENTSYISK